jgi:hypothetical protein
MLVFALRLLLAQRTIIFPRTLAESAGRNPDFCNKQTTKQSQTCASFACSRLEEKKNRVNLTPVSETMKVDSQLIQSFHAADNGKWKLGEVGVGNLLCIRPNKIKEKVQITTLYYKQSLDNPPKQNYCLLNPSGFV